MTLVLFTSAGQGGKTTGAQTAYSGNELKLTLLDQNRKFAVNNVEKDGNKMTVAYSNAKTEQNEKISYIITDKNKAEIKYYGAQASTEANGSLEITLPDIDKTDRIFVFNEQINGDMKTDYSSALCEAKIPEPKTISVYTDDADKGSVSANKTSAYPGETVILTAVPHDKYQLIGFEGDGISVDVNGNTGIFTMPDKNVSVKAIFGVKKAINIGSDVIVSRDNIYYANKNKWRVLSTNGNTTDGDTEPAAFKDNAGNFVDKNNVLFVISENDFGARRFDDNSNVWVGSESQLWCNGEFFNAAGFSDAEKKQILTTSKKEGESETEKLNEKVFFLSPKEADAYFTGETDKIFRPNGGSAACWFLRSPSSSTWIYHVRDDNGWTTGTPISYTYISRPAFNLNTSTVVLTSAASNGKIPGEQASRSCNDWKLTLLDDSRAFTLGNVTKSENKLTVSYSGAKTGAKEKISYLITDKDKSEIKYYGSQTATESGSVEIPLSLINAMDRLFIFNEQVNNNNETDYSSALQEVEIPERRTITVNVNDAAMGIAASDTPGQYSGKTVILTATPNPGYKFVKFTSDDVTILFSQNTCSGTFTMPDKDVAVTAVFELDKVDNITVKNGETYDLSGKEIPTSDIIVKTGGKIKDSSGGKGILKVARDEIYGKNYTDQFPLYDEQNGGYRFFDCEISAGYIEGDNTIIGTTLVFKDAETESLAKTILASDNSGVTIDVTLSKTDENGVVHKQVAVVPQSFIKNYAEDLTKPILMGVSGLKPGMTISVNYRFANGLVISKEVSNASPYITLETGADKRYTVNVYGMGLDGVVIVALYNSENQQELIDVKIQKIAEISGQLQGNGEFVKAMWWEGMSSMDPLCDDVGEKIIK